MDKPLEINLHQILRERLPRRIGRLVPGFFVTALEHLICQDELNRMLRVGFPKRGSAFSQKILRHLDISLEVEGMENIEGRRRLMFVSNHPLGGLDGIALIALLGQKYGDDGIRFIVNDMLMNVEPLRDMFLPVNKYGAQGRGRARAINEALASDIHILQFPAGLVSRLQPDGTLSDLQWQKSFVTKAIEYKRDIVPVHFIGENGMRFYRLAKWRKKLGIKVNIEQVFLPSEVCRSRGKRFRIVIGKPVAWEKLASLDSDPVKTAAAIKKMVYALK